MILAAYLASNVPCFPQANVPGMAGAPDMCPEMAGKFPGNISFPEVVTGLEWQ